MAMFASARARLITGLIAGLVLTAVAFAALTSRFCVGEHVEPALAPTVTPQSGLPAAGASATPSPTATPRP